MEPRIFSLRYRPQTFEELFDQEHVKRTLINAIANNRLAHAYLFTGPRGVGKTTTARILAKSLNCEHGPTVHPCNQCSACLEIKASKSLDVLEIDGASNRGIDQIRELRENIRYRPTSGRYRIYIIDEVHMLTTEAFNALLKTLEEPPAHVIFIFATTEPHKVPATILSRCQRFDFKRIPPEIIAERLKIIIDKESLDIEDEAVNLIADIADGGLRDAESVLEQITTFKEGRVRASDVTELLGIVPHDRFARFLELVEKRDESGVLTFLEETFSQGYDVAEFYFGIIGFLRTLLFMSLGMTATKSSLPESALKQTEGYTTKQFARMLETFLRSEEAFKRSREKVTFVETLALALIDMDTEDSKTSQEPASPDSRAPQDTSPEGKNPESRPARSDKKKSSSGESTDLPKDETDEASFESSVEEEGASIPEEIEAYHEEAAEPEETKGTTEELEMGLSTVEAWELFLKKISEEHSFLNLALKDSLVLKDTDSTIHIGITNNPELNVAHLDEEKGNLENRLAELAGRRIRLEFSSTAPQTGRQPKEKNKSSLEDVLEIFKGEIVR